MTLHIILAVGVIACSSLLGFYQSQRLSNRVALLDESLFMLQKMRAYLSHERFTTAQLIETLTHLNSLDTLAFLRACNQRLAAGEVFPLAWRNALTAGDQCDLLQEEDRKVLLMIGGILGTSSASIQQGELGVVEHLLQQRRAHAEKQCREKGGLYRSLGVLFGIGIAILIV